MTIGEFVDLARGYAEIAWGRRVFIAACAAIVAVLGAVRKELKVPEYEAQIKILPYRSSASGGGLSGLAGLAGIRLPVSGGEQTIGVELYPDVAKTIDFKVAVAEAELTFPSRRNRLTLLAYLGDSVSSGPASDQASEFRSIKYPEGVAPYTPKYLGAVSAAASRVEVLYDRRTSIVTVKARLPDDVAAAELAYVASQRLMDRVRAVDVRKAEEQLRFVENAYASSVRRYEAAQMALARYVDRNRILNSAVSQVERSRLERESELAFEVYQQLSRELEQAKTRVSQDSPVFSVLEPATVPTSPIGAGLIQTIFIAGFLGGIAGLVVVFWRELTSKMNHAG